MGWGVDPLLFLRGRSNLESHRDQSCIVGDIVAYVKMLVFRQVRDRLWCGRPQLTDSCFSFHQIVWCLSRMGRIDNETRGEKKQTHGRVARGTRIAVCEDRRKKGKFLNALDPSAATDAALLMG